MDPEDDESIAEDSLSEFQYDPSNDNISEDDDDGDAMVIEPPEIRKLPYLVMHPQDVAARQTRCMSDSAELLQINLEDAFFLLRNFGWDASRLQEAWFNNSKKVIELCGLSPSGCSTGVGATTSSSSSTSAPGSCPICMQNVPQLTSLPGCGHGFCHDCWRGHLHCQVSEGRAAIQTRCPQHKCGRAVPREFFLKFCEEPQRNKYEEWYRRSYVDDNPSVKWCTNPQGCNMAIEYQGADPIEVRCGCEFLFCWACGEEAHRPADCKTVGAWNVKNSAESENISWIRANTKKCPKCHRAIEKNQGCNHMVCSKAGGCGHEFCWLCLGDWSTHGTSTGGYYQCNIYDKQAKEGKHAEEEKSRMRAKHALDKYMFYFERFMDHDRSMKLTVKEEADIEERVQQLHDKHGFEIIELQFLYDALRQVRACRQVLKWTYVYGYYLDEAGPEKNLFEHLQKNLEEKTDCLHEMLEKELDQKFFGDVGPQSSETIHQEFMTFRSHVTNFTNVTQKFRSQILMDITNGVGLVDPSASPSSMRPSASPTIM